jgi:hypothetical protein
MNDEKEKPKTEPPEPPEEEAPKVLTPREAAQIFGNLRLGGLHQRRRYPYSIT